MQRIIYGRRYLMRDTRPHPKLMALYRAFCEKYGETDIHRWLTVHGKVYLEIKPRK